MVWKGKPHVYVVISCRKQPEALSISPARNGGACVTAYYEKAFALHECCKTVAAALAGYAWNDEWMIVPHEWYNKPHEYVIPLKPMLAKDFT